MSRPSTNTLELSAKKRALLEALLRDDGVTSSVSQGIPRRQAGDVIPLSFAQQRLWFLDQLEPSSGFYNVPSALRVRGPLHSEALHKALDIIVSRHEVLRTTFVAVDGNPFQVIGTSGSVELPLIDLSDRSDMEREREVQRIIRKTTRCPFDLSKDSMLRAALIRLETNDHLLLLVTHHIASDGWSTGVLFRELAVLYEAFSTGKVSPLPELPIQYADFAVWQRGWLQGEVLERQLSYWKKKLAGIAVLELPTDRPRPSVQSYRGGRESLALSEALSEELKAFSRKEGATLFMTLLAAFQILLHRYTGQEDIAVGSPIANRTRAELECLIGFFVNTLVLRTDVSGNPTFSELVGRVRKVALEAYGHQDLPFEKLVEELNPDRKLSRTPLFQAMFVFQNAPRSDLELSGLEMKPVRTNSTTAKFDLTLSVMEGAGALRVSLEYSTDLFDAGTITRMLGHFRNLLEDIVANPDRRLSDLAILTEAEKHQLVVEWNDTKRDYPKDKCIHELFEAQVEKTPEAVAVVFEDQQLTYRQLNARANQLAHYLRTLGVGPDVLVGVCAERSVEMVVALLAIVKEGAAYVPLDPQYPKERLKFMLEDTRASIIVTQRRLRDWLPSHEAAVVYLDDEAAWATEPDENPVAAIRPENLLYVMYTSGSTGTPKGVSVVHRGVVRLVKNTDYAELTSDEVLLQFAPISFDASTFEIWGALLNGAKLVVFPPHTPSLEELGRFIESYGVTTLWLTAALFHQMVEGQLSRFKGVRQLLAGGDVLSVRHVGKCLHELRNCRLVNGYGPTENTTFTCCYPMTDAKQVSHSVSIGRPIANTQVYVLDVCGNPVPVGVPGELYIGGDGLARGYLNQPELTREKFVPNPFSDEPGARLYRTGDLVRYRSDGTIEFLWRLDHQVKIRGFRVELGEIEAVLSQHPTVKETVVIIREDVMGEKRLVAYVVPSQEAVVDSSEMRTFLQQKLPDYMIPSAFVFLDALPLSPNGKVDRRALPAPVRPERENNFVAPRTAMEEILAGIWCQILNVQRVGIHDNFFELGGHSLLATQIISRVQESSKVELPLRSLFESPTVAELAERIEESLRGKRGFPILPILPLPRDGDLPLSFAQQRLWFLDRLEPNSSVYNIPSGLRLKGPLDVGALEQSLNEIVRRHEALRTTISIIEGQPVQRISPSLSLPLPVVDLSQWPESEREDEAKRLANEEAHRPFDLSLGPLMRSVLLHLGSEDHVLLLTMHHIAADGWSMGVLFREFSALYEAFSNGKPSPLESLPVQYADFAQWQREWLQGEVLETQLGYWRNQLESIQTLRLPTDRPRPAVPSYRGASRSMVLSRDLTEALKTLSRQQGVTLFMTLLAAFQTLLYRYTGQDDIAVGSPIAGRNRREIEGLIGFFVNTLLLRTDLSGNPNFRELLHRVREMALGAYAHQDLPFEKLVEELRPDRNLSRSPLFQVMFVLQNAPGTELRFEGLNVSPVRIGGETAKFDLTLSVHEAAEEGRVSLQYNTDLFDEATITRMLGHFEVLLESMVANPDQRISDLPILGDSEKRQLLVDWNNTDRDYPRDKCIHHLFEAQVERTPEAVAVAYEDKHLTYQELNARANQLARYLRTLGVGPEMLMGICMERSLDMVIGLLGILKAGGAYVPLDPDYPKERLAFMLEDASVPVLLTQQKLLRHLPDHRAKVVCLDKDWESILAESEENPVGEAASEKLAYVIYTSGSTGKPKGVAVPQRAVVRLVINTDYVDLRSDDVVAQVSNCSFDAATFEIWGALLNGARLVIVTKEIALAPEEFAGDLKRHGVTTLFLTTALFNLMIQQAPQAFPMLRHMLFGGEAVDPRWVAKLLKEGPPERLLHVYGPTETTTFATWQLVREVAESAATVPIGRPIANTKVYVLDTHRQPVPIGVPGELYIGGDGVAQSYLNRPELTDERFVYDPFSDEPGARLYRTGDLVRYRSDGTIEFLGRLDHQVKIRGFRIELGEIEAVLSQHPKVRETVVIIREDVVGEKRLVAYVVFSQVPAVESGELRTFLRQKLPDYMIPSRFVFLDSLPLTLNGKIDRRTLPAPSEARDDRSSSYVAPHETVEVQLVQIWERLLGIRPIGTRDNFFDLGGHSLLAVRLVAEIEKAFGKSIPLADLFRAPTIEQLASTLHSQESSRHWSRLIPFQTGGSKPPFFCIHGGAEDLAKLLGMDQPFYGFQAHGQDGRQAPSKVEDMASDYIKEIRTIQPKGPYYLGGYSFGGMVVFEVAQQLHKQGEEVGLLALLDPTKPIYRKPASLDSASSPPPLPNFTLLRDKVCRHLGNLALLGFRERLGYLWQRVRWRIEGIKKELKMFTCRFYLTVGQRVPFNLRMFYFFEISYQAARKYTPQVYTGRMILFRTKTPSYDSRLDWPRLAAGGLEIPQIPGKHLEILKEPYVQVLAEHLKECLNGARTTKSFRQT